MWFLCSFQRRALTLCPRRSLIFSCSSPSWLGCEHPFENLLLLHCVAFLVTHEHPRPCSEQVIFFISFLQAFALSRNQNDLNPFSMWVGLSPCQQHCCSNPIPGPYTRQCASTWGHWARVCVPGQLCTVSLEGREQEQDKECEGNPLPPQPEVCQDCCYLRHIFLKHLDRSNQEGKIPLFLCV